MFWDNEDVSVDCESRGQKDHAWQQKFRRRVQTHVSVFLYGIPALEQVPKLFNEAAASYHSLKTADRFGARHLTPRQRGFGKAGLAAMLGSYLGRTTIQSLLPGVIGSLWYRRNEK